ncbi:MAG: hypothetical protein ACM3XN_08605 [Chloroflexota bacterium]
MLIIFALVLLASVTPGPVRWLAAAGVAVALVSIFAFHKQAYPERLTFTVSDYQAVAGGIRLAGALANTGSLNLYRPELIVSVGDEHGNVLASRSIWPTGQLRRRMAVGASVPVDVSLPVAALPERAVLTIKATEYPLALVVACAQPQDLSRLRAT